MSELLKEIKQSKPFANIEEEVFLNLQRTAYVLLQEKENLFREFDITSQQYNVLRILRGARDTGLACSEIGNRLITKDSDITRLLNRLEASGLILKCRDENDKRFIVSKISERGLSLLKKLDEPVVSVSKRLLEHLGPELLDQFNALLVLARKSSS